MICNSKGKAESNFEPPLFQGIPHRYNLTSNSPVTIGKCSVYTKMTVFEFSIHPFLTQECFYSSVEKPYFISSYHATYNAAIAMHVFHMSVPDLKPDKLVFLVINSYA